MEEEEVEEEEGEEEEVEEEESKVTTFPFPLCFYAYPSYLCKGRAYKAYGRV